MASNPFKRQFRRAAEVVASLAALLGLGIQFLGERWCSPNGGRPAPAASTSGVNKVTVTVPTGTDGLTVEQRNVSNRLQVDNQPGSIKHLYVIAPKSGKCVLYSTVRAKLTSGGKRLSPTLTGPNSTDADKNEKHDNDFPIDFADSAKHYTHEILADDGAYGSYGVSGGYLFWWDAGGAYHQHHLADGQIVHVSSEPVRFREVVTDAGTRPTTRGEDR